ncbi:CPBP family intramembrane glutamic endopeptidase [Adlercreutzia sp. ZJ138]|uniref:CPBP family intramembrane glutamic endopeptidase n=1 Tax=Adlercreutzia sp. ZJ138 TaxID=2709405 RepID=UPI0013ECC1CB|nr:CPBP family intramembrane glutamic endopeptidase [Adlercreutzia sp. ZJ138]
MENTDKALVRRRTILYVAVTFVLTWGYWFVVVYPRVNAPQGLESTGPAALLVGVGMLFPAIAALIVRLVTREGFSNALIRPVQFRRTWKWWVLGWFGPQVLMTLGAVAYFCLFPGDFDPSGGLIRSQMEAQAAQTGVGMQLDDNTFRMIVIAQIAMAVLAAPALNAVTCFGEEWGWRGYLLPKLLKQMHVAPALVVSGVIWGLWHAPITVLGHNYGVGYAGWPFVGIAAMCMFCMALGVFFSYITLRSGSCIPAVLAHGATNGFVAAPLLFSATGGNPFVGPCATGIVGGSALIIVAVVMAASLISSERRGEPLLLKRNERPAE